MYYENTKPIPVPESSEKGKVIVAKTTGYVYLQTGYEWDVAKKQPIYKRTTIGKIVAGDSSQMYFSPNYEEIFGVVDIEVCELRKKYGTRELKLAGKYNISLSFAPFAVVEAACEKAGCLAPLKRVFPKKWRLILGLCVHAIADESTTSQSFPGWCFTNYCGINRVIADSEISKLYQFIYDNRGDIQVFSHLYQKEYNERFPSNQRRAVGFDSTNQNYGGDGIPFAKRGHPKIDVGLPIINTAMMVDEKTGIPLWYEHFDGSLNDKTQNPFSLKKAVNLGFKKLFVVYDRGYYSEEDIIALEKLKETEFGVLCSDGVDWVEDLIREHGKDIKDQQMYYVPDENVYANVYEVKPFEKNGNENTYYAYLFYDSERASDERDTIHDVVSYHWNLASSRKRYSEKMASEYASKGIIVVKTQKDPETGKNFQLLEDTQMIQSLLDMKGFFVMISTTKLTPHDAICFVRQRDTSEKAFARMMKHFHLRTTGRHKKDTYVGMMFLSFIALICLSSFQYFEKPYLHAVTSRTTATVFAELEKYQMIWNEKEGVWEPGYAMNKDQKDICGYLDLSEEQLQQKIDHVKMKSSASKGAEDDYGDDNGS